MLTSTEAIAEVPHSIAETAACAAMPARVVAEESAPTAEADVQLQPLGAAHSAESHEAAMRAAILPVDSRASAADMRVEEDTRAEAVDMAGAADTAN